MSEAINTLASRITVSFSDEDACTSFFAAMKKRHCFLIERSFLLERKDTTQVSILATVFFIQDIWNCVCSDDVNMDCPGKVTNIAIELLPKTFLHKVTPVELGTWEVERTIDF